MFISWCDIICLLSALLNHVKGQICHFLVMQCPIVYIFTERSYCWFSKCLLLVLMIGLFIHLDHKEHKNRTIVIPHSAIRLDASSNVKSTLDNKAELIKSCLKMLMVM